MERTVRRWIFWLRYNQGIAAATFLAVLVLALFYLVVQDVEPHARGRLAYHTPRVQRLPPTGDSNPELPRQYSDTGKERHLALKQRCEAYHPLSNTVPSYSMEPVVSLKKNLFYCPLAKAGSTFFTRYLINIDMPGEMKSPYSVAIENAQRSRLATFSSLGAAKQQFFIHAYKAVFTRDPYSRMFSAYVDKLYSPNPYFWSAWGISAIKATGLDLNKHNCGSGVPFHALVRYIVNELHKKDLHFIPMNTMCKLCDSRFDFVGKMEHAVEDIDELSSHLNVSSSFQHKEDYRMATASDVIHDSLKDPMHGWWKQITGCISPYDAGRLIWRRLQIRGIFYKDIPFPFSPEQMESITPDAFRQQCLTAAEKSTDRTRLKEQKSEAIRQAFSRVNEKDIQKLRSIYQDDFYLLDYDPSPKSLFGEGPVTEVDIFDWTKEWT